MAINNRDGISDANEYPWLAARGRQPGSWGQIYGMITVNRILFLLLFLIPVASVAFYEIFVATDRYQSVASIIITEERPSAPTVDLSMLGMGSSSSDSDALVLKEFIESRSMLSYLDENLKLKEHFRNTAADPVARLDADASFEDFHEYFLKFMVVEYDVESKILRFSFQSFDRQYTQDVVKKVLERSQIFIDRLNEVVTRDQLKFFDKQIVQSQKRLRESNQRLIEFQRENDFFTTEAATAPIMATLTSLQTELATKKSELDARSQVLTDQNAPQLSSLRRQIKALTDLIGKETERLAGSKTLTSLNELDSKFRAIQLELEFNTNIYKANLSALESARLEAARRLKFLIVVAEPSLADASEFPQRGYIVLTWAMVLLIVYFVVSLMVSIVREHA